MDKIGVLWSRYKKKSSKYSVMDARCIITRVPSLGGVVRHAMKSLATAQLVDFRNQ